MLRSISYETLKRAAVYGAVISVSGCSILYYLLQRKLASSGYYIKTVEALRHDQMAVHMLGDPIRIQALKLNDRRNQITTQHAQVLIPVSGTKSAGYLYSQSTHRFGQWELDHVVLEFKGRPEKLVILDTNTSNTTMF